MYTCILYVSNTYMYTLYIYIFMYIYFYEKVWYKIQATIPTPTAKTEIMHPKILQSYKPFLLSKLSPNIGTIISDCWQKMWTQSNFNSLLPSSKASSFGATFISRIVRLIITSYRRGSERQIVFQILYGESIKEFFRSFGWEKLKLICNGESSKFQSLLKICMIGSPISQLASASFITFANNAAKMFPIRTNNTVPGFLGGNEIVNFFVGRNFFSNWIAVWNVAGLCKL